jgi:serine protease inhibitor
MMKKALFLLFVLACFSCEKSNPPTPIDPIPVTEVQKIADMNQSFGWELFHQEMAANPNKNVLISPWSIQTALHMANNGAKSNTLNEILAAIHCPDCSVEDINAQQAKLSVLLEQQSGHPRLKSTNALFYDTKRINVMGAYQQALYAHYSAGIASADFDNEASALQIINSWVQNNTNGKIDQIIESIKKEDIAFLINALHFKADWSSAFPLQTTSDADFTTASGAVVKVPMMSHDWQFTFAEGPKMRMVDLPFKDSTYSLTLVQPTQANTAHNWYKEVNSAALKSLYAAAQTDRAIVSLPRFKLAYDANLVESLKKLGVNDAFSDARADFSSMGTSSGRIFINQIRHKSVLEVDEKGAEGAAVTSVGFGVTSVPPVFAFNRPFVLALRHISTNTLIFTGYLAQP